jgi:hypothetical protein
MPALCPPSLVACLFEKSSSASWHVHGHSGPRAGLRWVSRKLRTFSRCALQDASCKAHMGVPRVTEAGY